MHFGQGEQPVFENRLMAAGACFNRVCARIFSIRPTTFRQKRECRTRLSKERVQNTAFSVFLFVYGSYGVWVNDLYIPGKRSRGIHLHDVPAWIMYGAMICACLVMLSVVVDHYDRRNNETNYKRFANGFRMLGWGFFGLSLVMAIVR